MQFALELEGSEVRDVAADGDVLHIRLAAASVRDADGERGWLPGVTLRLASATSTGDAPHAFGRLADGELRLDGRRIAPLRLPGELSGALELALRFSNGSVLELRAEALELELSVAEGARFAPDLSW
jgi:hypothetical protein